MKYRLPKTKLLSPNQAAAEEKRALGSTKRTLPGKKPHKTPIWPTNNTSQQKNPKNKEKKF